jgi:hypothetical protein
MRVRSLLAAAAALTIGASVANADFQVTSTRTPGSGAMAGFDIIKMFALNDGNNGTGTQLQSVDVQITLDQAEPLKFRLIDSDGDGVDDVDLFLTVPGFSTANPQGTYVRIGAPTSWNVASAPSGLSSDPDGDGTANSNPGQTFADTKSVRVAGFNSAGVAANAGSGAQFGAIVVPSSLPDTAWHATGGVAGTTGGITNFVLPVPEPGTFGLLGIGAMGFLARRRRA